MRSIAESVEASTLQVFNLDGRVAIVTGAAGLLGRMHCNALASAGANVIAVDLKEQECEEFVIQLGENYGVRAMSLGTDITSADQVCTMRERALAAFGRIDILVNNAGLNDSIEASSATGASITLENYPIDIWERFLAINLTGTFLCCQVIGSEMARCKKGSIVNVASTYAIVAPDQSLYEMSDGTKLLTKSPAYVASKGGMLSLTRYLASYWGRSGVRVNALSPGGVENGQEAEFIEKYSSRTPLGRMATAYDYSGALLFLSSDASSYMTGANLVVDGGWTIW
jgi:NAD(P)-dependent dehydrogenase (short-subunit alcohol dehydrogenase family)